MSFISEKIERKFGFSTRTWKRWARDHVLAFTLTLVLFVIVFLFLYSAIREFPDVWWFFGFLGFFVLAAVLMTIAPILIVPIFMKMEPLPEGELRERIENLAHKMNLKYKDISV